MLPILESLIPGYAGAMMEALDAGDYDDLRRMIELLAALGVRHEVRRQFTTSGRSQR